MSRHAGLISLLSVFAFGATAMPAGMAQAADMIRYISTAGNNSSTCTLAAPCRTLQRGINKTPAGGELRILDSGDYGMATIGKSMTISGNDHTVIVKGIFIDNASAVVVLRGLTLTSDGLTLRGIDITAATKVHIERCVTQGFLEDGIRVDGAAAHVFVTDSTSRNNGNSGVLVRNSAAARLTVDNSRFEGNSSGVAVASGEATIGRSVASGNGADGISVANGRMTVSSTTATQNGTVSSNSGFKVQPGGEMTLESSVSRGNGRGLTVLSGGTARVSNSSFTNNALGLINQGTLLTRQNNTVSGNTTETSGTLTPVNGI